jgi:spore coat polysaccharide biosynthesis predicted glycosyltransferase SpsG/CMP-N-acetylneuraminic acid synthetase
VKEGARVLAVIPARGGRDPIPYLNIKPLGGKPLLAYTIEAARASRHVDRLVVSTNDPTVAEVAQRYGAEVPFLRPEELSQNIPSLNPVLLHAAEGLERLDGFRADVVVSLLPVTPFRGAPVIDQAIETLLERGADSVITLTEEKWMNWKLVEGRLVPLYERRGRREEMEAIYREVGAVLAIRRAVLSTEARLGEKIGYVVMDKYSAFTIYTLSDFWAAERLLRHPRVVFRVDGGREIGMGHVFRSLAMAEALRRVSSAEVHFLMAAEHPEGIGLASRYGYPVRVVGGGQPEPVLAVLREVSPNVIVNDLPFISAEYLRALSHLGASTVNVVDSLSDLERPGEYAQIIISMLREEAESMEEYYAGPEYAILRGAFRGREKVIRPEPEALLVTFGGSDPQGLTPRTLRALARVPAAVAVNVVLGPAFSHRQELERLLAAPPRPFRLLERVDQMAALIDEADLVICSGGMTVYELAALGTPGIVLCQNAREAERMARFAQHGTVVNLGLGTEVGEAAIAETVGSVLADAGLRRRLSDSGRRLVDGLGTNRVVDVIMRSSREVV